MHNYLSQFLSAAAKPAYYIGNEINSIVKSDENLLSGVLLSPVGYAEAMSIDSFRRLYVLLNKSAKIYWQRAFLPELTNDIDLLAELNLPLFTLEKNVEVKSANLLLVFISDIIQYLFVSQLFNSIGLPLNPSDREIDAPYIIAFGPGIINPRPLSSFFDAFFIGEADLLPPLLDKVYPKLLDRDDFVSLLAEHPGILLSADANNGKKAVRQINPHLSNRMFPSKLPVPHLDIRQNVSTIESSRGSFSGIRSRASDFITRPLRVRRIEDVILEIKNAVRYEGARVFEISAEHLEENDKLIHLIKKLKISAKELNFRFFIKGFLFEPDSAIDDALKNIVRERFEIPLYTVDPDLRSFLNLTANIPVLERMISHLISLGWEHFTIKILLGIPGETNEAVSKTAKWLHQLLEKLIDYPQATFQLNIQSFTPSPFSPLQREACLTPDEFAERASLLTGQLNNKRISLRVADLFKGPVQTILFRSGAEISKVLVKDIRSIEEWFRYFNSEGYHSKLQTMSLYEEVPWDNIDYGISAKFLQDERMRAFDRKLTHSCLLYKCYQCGLQRPPFREQTQCHELASDHPEAGKYDHLFQRFAPVEERVLSFGRSSKKREEGKPQLIRKMRIKYIKKGMGRFFTHQDIGRIIDFASLISGFPVAYSQGKIPKAKMSFGLPLTLGYESKGEYIDLDILVLREADMMEKINRFLPSGVMITNAVAIFKKVKSLLEVVNETTYHLEYTGGGEGDKDIFDELYSIAGSKEKVINRNIKNEENNLIIGDYFKKVEKDGNRVKLTFFVDCGKSIKLEEIVDLCPSWQKLKNNYKITRTGQRHINNTTKESKDPIALLT